MTQTAIAEVTEETKPCVVIIRPEFMEICNNDACKSATLNHVLYWIAQKIKKGVQYWYATGEQIWEGMNKSWGITTIRKAVKDLVSAGFLGQRRNPKVGIDQTRQYFFGKEQVATFIQACEDNHVCLLCIELHKDVSHLIDLSNGDIPFDRFVKCICQNCQLQLTDLSKQYQRLLTKITDKEESVIPGESSGESNISSSSEDEIAHRYKRGHAAIQGSNPHQDIISMTSLLTAKDDAFLAEMEKMLPPADLSTPLPHNVDNDNHSHSHVVQAIGEEGERDGHHSDRHHEHSRTLLRDDRSLPLPDTQSARGHLGRTTQVERFQVEAAPAIEQPPALQIGATSPPTRETRKRGVGKNGLSLQGQHILDEYQKFKGRKSTPGKATIEAANALVGLVASDEEFTAVLTEIRDNKYLNDNNIARDLDFVYRKYERYRDIVEQKQTRAQPGWRPAPPPGVKDYTGMGKLLHQQEARRGQTFTA